ncbi:glycoside hydrolase, partial [Mycena floridula]
LDTSSAHPTSRQTTSTLTPQKTIPSLNSFTLSSAGGSFILNDQVQIFVDPAFNDTLWAYAQTFRADLASVAGYTSIADVITDTISGSQPSIFLTAGAENHVYFNGKPTGEGYDYDIQNQTYTIRGGEAVGTWWGTRTLLQQVVMAKVATPDSISIPAGSGSDTPGWEIRGLMLDVGRHWYTTSFLGTPTSRPFLLSTDIPASFFKLQSLHLHASDNVWDINRVSIHSDYKDLYSAFRFQPSENSPITGLVPLRNESWTFDEFTELQNTCTVHGVTLIPEIDTPAHSLAITKWKPQLMLQQPDGFADCLNLSHPETLPTVKSIWDEVLPWFTSTEVHIGADEYPADVDDYTEFINNMSSYISSTSQKSIRVWGTTINSSQSPTAISTDVTIQHWDSSSEHGTNPVELVQNGYRVINSEQSFLYLDEKLSDGGSLPWELRSSQFWKISDDGSQTGWAPNIVSSSDETKNLGYDEPRLRGSTFALWSDWGNNATTPLEVYYQLAKSIPMYAEKAWYGPPPAPGQNLNRGNSLLLSDEKVLFQYPSIDSATTTNLTSVGPPYVLTFTNALPDTTLTFTIRTEFNVTSKEDVIFEGGDSRLHDPATNQFYPLTGFDSPSTLEDITVEIHAERNFTYAVIKGTTYWWQTTIGDLGSDLLAANMSFAAPSHVLRKLDSAGHLTDVSLVLGS